MRYRCFDAHLQRHANLLPVKNGKYACIRSSLTDARNSQRRSDNAGRCGAPEMMEGPQDGGLRRSLEEFPGNHTP
jgi:hypothetical protein